MKTFKNGQKVTHPKYGEGIFRKAPIFPNSYLIEFKEFETQPMQIGNELYYQLEAVEDLPEIGEYAYFWKDGWDYCAYAKYFGKKDGKYQVLNVLKIPVDYSYVSKTPPKFD